MSKSFKIGLLISISILLSPVVFLGVFALILYFVPNLIDGHIEMPIGQMLSAMAITFVIFIGSSFIFIRRI